MALKHTSKNSSWGLNDTKYWRLFIVEYLQPNKLKNKSNFNLASILSFLVFFHESTENCWSSFYNVNLGRQSPLGVFLRDKTILDFFLAGGRDATFVTPVRARRKYHISIYFLRKVISHFLARKKISCFWGKNTNFLDNTRKIMSPRGSFWEEHLFRKFEENVIFPCIFLRKMIFPDNTRKIIFQRDFFGKTIFSGRLEKENMVSSVVLIIALANLVSPAICWEDIITVN